MKEIKCQECGDVIESGYAVNPQMSDLCATCYEEWYGDKRNDLNDDFAGGRGENINL